MHDRPGRVAARHDLARRERPKYTWRMGWDGVPERGEAHIMPVLLSVNVGLPRDVAWQGKTVHTGVWKEPVDGPVMVCRLNIDGDG
jgi:hypothetical protein